MVTSKYFELTRGAIENERGLELTTRDHCAMQTKIKKINKKKKEAILSFYPWVTTSFTKAEVKMYTLESSLLSIRTTSPTST